MVSNYCTSRFTFLARAMVIFSCPLLARAEVFWTNTYKVMGAAMGLYGKFQVAAAISPTRRWLCNWMRRARVTTIFSLTLPMSALIVLLPLPVAAITITFLEPSPDDSPGNITIVQGESGPPFPPPTCLSVNSPVSEVCMVGHPTPQPEQAHIELLFPPGSFPVKQADVVGARAFIVEPNSSKISDVVTATFKIPSDQQPNFSLVLNFQSDVAERPLNPATIPDNFQGAVVETGGIQPQPLPLDRFFTGSEKNPSAASLPKFGFDIEFRSGTCEAQQLFQSAADSCPRPGASAPEPSTLLLLGSGLVAIVLVGFRRKRF